MATINIKNIIEKNNGLLTETDFKEISEEIMQLGKNQIIEANNDDLQIIYLNLIENCYTIGTQLAAVLRDYILNISSTGKKITLKNPNNDTTRYIVLLTTQFIFLLRSLVTGEELQFSIAGTTTAGQLKEKIYSQNEIMGENILQKLQLTEAGAIELQSSLESLTNLALNQSRLSEYWPYILDWGYSADYKDGVTKPVAYYATKSTKNNNPHPLYQQQKMDAWVYYYMSGAYSKKTYLYYHTNELKSGKDNPYSSITKDLVMYDRGWLYQWGKILEEQNSLESINDYKNNYKHPLMPLIYFAGGRENLPGIRGGDYGKYQYKHQNQRIITINNIYNILTGGGSYQGILPALEVAKTMTNNIQKGLEYIAQDFIALNAEVIKDGVKDASEKLTK